jgi:hypothetical protein
VGTGAWAVWVVASIAGIATTTRAHTFRIIFPISLASASCNFLFSRYGSLVWNGLGGFGSGGGDGQVQGGQGGGAVFLQV